jgi:hypothetical protein
MAGSKYYSTIGNKGAKSQAADLGISNNSALESAFPSSPIHSGKAIVNGSEEEYDEDTLPDIYKNLALDGEVLNGNGFTSFNRDYSQNGAPDIPNIEQDNEGNPLYSPYMPNLVSPGPGSVEPSDEIHSVPAPHPSDVANKNFGTGLGGVFNPLKSADLISSQGVKRDSGRSF